MGLNLATGVYAGGSDQVICNGRNVLGHLIDYTVNVLKNPKAWEHEAEAEQTGLDH